jgi:hypothetical protein
MENICYKKARKNKDKYRQRKYRNGKDRKEKRMEGKKEEKGIVVECRK